VGIAAVALEGGAALYQANTEIVAGNTEKARETIATSVTKIESVLAGAGVGAAATGAYFFWLEGIPVWGQAAHAVVTLAGGALGAIGGEQVVKKTKDLLSLVMEHAVGIDSDPMGTGDSASIMNAITSVAKEVSAYNFPDTAGAIHRWLHHP
jgi:hypothetical protein